MGVAIENGEFNRCGAKLNSGKDMMRINNHPNGKWFLTLPSVGAPPSARLSGMIELGRASIPSTFSGGGRTVTELSRDVQDYLRGGASRIQVEVGGRSFDFTMSDTAGAMGAVQDCVNQGRNM